MSKTPKFLYTRDELGRWFASFGRRLKAAKKAGEDIEMLTYMFHEVGQAAKDYKTAAKHAQWYRFYVNVFKKEYSRALTKLGKSEKQAYKYARQKAEYATVSDCPGTPKSTRAVRNVMKKFEDPRNSPSPNQSDQDNNSENTPS